MLGDPAKPKEEILAEPPRAADALIYGWSQELQLAWRSRKPPGRAKPYFDLSMPVVAPSGADDSEAIVAKWPDGETHIITDLTWGQLRGLQVRAPGAVGAGPLWAGETHDTHHALKIEQRVGRSLLMSLREQSRQVLQLRQDIFGEVKDHSKQLHAEDPTCKAALAFLVDLATDYAEGKVPLESLKQERGCRLKKLGLWDTRPRRDVRLQKHLRKRPAAGVEAAAADVADRAPLRRVMSKTTVHGVAASIGTTPLSAQRPIEEPAAEDPPATADDDAVSCDDGWATVPESFFEIA